MSDPKTAPLTPARLEEAEQVIAKATPGPWMMDTSRHHAQNQQLESAHVVRTDVPRYRVASLHITAWKQDRRDARHDAEFIALSRTLLPDLLAVVRGLLALEPEIEADLAMWDRVRATNGVSDQPPAETERLLRQVRALIEGGA